MLTRRQFTSSTLAVTGSLLLPNASGAASGGIASLIEAIKQLELKSGGRLGVCVFDTTTVVPIHYRGDERFPMCSTFKVLAAAAILKAAGTKLEGLERRVHIEQADLVEYSPVTSEHVGGEGMTLRELLRRCRHPKRQHGRQCTPKEHWRSGRLDQLCAQPRRQYDEIGSDGTQLNEASPGDPRDTTTPNAMAANYRRLLLGDVLLPAGRDQLGQWLIANKTGDTRLRAGVPQGWRVGDKTGAGEHGTCNDVAIVWPPARSPLIIAVYLTGASLAPNARNEVIASVGREVGRVFG